MAKLSQIALVLLAAIFDPIHSEDSLVETEYGWVKGKVFTLPSGKSIKRFHGIPFAKPPVGDLRFKAPEKHSGWTETLEANDLPAACPQSPQGVIWFTHFGWDKYDEDCLTVNIYAPNDTSNAPSPVMFYVHAGAFTSSANVQYPGHFLAGKDVVVVVTNYRLGNLGFASTNDDAARGNYGLLDQILALEFVRDNIEHFGGDPNKVTAFGQSAGAASVSLLSLSPRAKGLFHQFIPQSGSELAIWAVNGPPQMPWSYTKQIATKLDCPTEDSQEMMDCLRTKTFTEIRETGFDCTPGYFCQGMAPVVDGSGGVIPDLPKVIRESGDYEALPMMSGICKDDGSLYTLFLIPESNDGGFNRSEFERIMLERLVSIFAPAFPAQEEDMLQAMLGYYTPYPYKDDEEENRQAFNVLITDFGFGFADDAQAKYHVAKGQDKVYMYNLGYRSKNADRLVPEWMGVPHQGDLPYVFAWSMMQLDRTIRRDTGILLDVINWDDEDIQWAEYIMTLWTNFAKYGNPTPEPVAAPGDVPLTWNKFDTTDYRYFYMDRQSAEMTEYRQRNFAFWTQYLTYMLELDNVWDIQSVHPRKSRDTKRHQSGIDTAAMQERIDSFYRDMVNKRLRELGKQSLGL